MEERKKDHLRICLEKDVESEHNLTGFQNYSFIHNALPEIDKEQINLRTRFLGKNLSAPIMISSMTGGTSESKKINRNFAKAAQNLNIALALGSARILKNDKAKFDSYNVRDIAPDILLFANIGAVQLNYDFTIQDCQEIVERLKADALILHLNPLQEAIQPEGDTNFKGLLPKIKELCQNLGVPVIVKEVGCGISGKVAKRLMHTGVSVIDVAGLGGTSFAMVEGYRANKDTGELFKKWGIPTTTCIKQIKKTGLPIIASGGIRSGLDVAKSIALGADIAGIALPLLKQAMKSAKNVEKYLKKVIDELTIAMFCLGIQNIEQLKKAELIQIK